MNIEMVDGEVVLIGIDGSPVVEPQPGRLQCVTYDEGHWEMRFATSHWRVRRNWGPARTAGLARWRQRVGVLAYDEAVADKWGQLQARA